jgi:Uma2 family endonuclease
VVELLSPPTRRTDLVLKPTEYAGAGVREYWAVDPRARSIAVYGADAELPVLVRRQAAPVASALLAGLSVSYDDLAQGSR